MTRTAQQVEGDFYKLIKESQLGQQIGGKVYRHGMRPRDSKAEDIVVAFLAGQDGTFQTGVVVANIYVPDINHNGERVANLERIEELEILLQDLLTQTNRDYWIETETTPTLVHNEEIDQDCIVARLRFERPN